jgi:hypothetical protein
LAAEERWLVVQLKEGNGVIAFEVRGHGAPEVEGFRQACLIHRILKEALFQIADGVPVNIDVHSKICGPLNGLVEQGEVIFCPAPAPRNRVNRNADHSGSGLLDFDEKVFVPMALAGNLIWIAYIDAAKENGLAGGIDEPIATDGDQRQLLCVRAVQKLRWIDCVPPIARLRGCWVRRLCKGICGK